MKAETWLIVDPGKTCGFALWQVDEKIARLMMAGTVLHSFALDLLQRLAPDYLVMESFPTSTRLSWKGQAKLLEDLSGMETDIVKIPASSWKGGRFDHLAHRRADQTFILGDHLRDALALSRFAFHQASKEVELCES